MRLASLAARVLDGGTPAQEQADAQRQLEEFVASSEGWEELAQPLQEAGCPEDVAYFLATVLVSKVRSCTEPAHAHEVAQLGWGLLAGGGAGAGRHLVRAQAGRAVAAMAALRGQGGVRECVTAAASALQQSGTDEDVLLAVGLLQDVAAEAARSLERIESDVMAALRGCQAEVLATLEAAAAAAASRAADERVPFVLVGAMCTCVNAWREASGLSLPQVADEAPTLLQAVLDTLIRDEADAARQESAALLEGLLHRAGRDERRHVATALTLLGVLLTVAGPLVPPDGSALAAPASVGRSLAVVLAALVEALLHAWTTGADDPERVLPLLLALSGVPDPDVATLALASWPQLTVVLVAMPNITAWHRRLLPLLLAHARVPEELAWDLCNAESDDEFSAFREQQVAECVACVAGTLQLEFVRMLQDRLGAVEAQSWQDAEALLFCVRAAWTDLGSMGSQASEQGVLTSGFLATLIQALPGLSALHPLACFSGCRLIGCYAGWMARTATGTELARGAMSFLLGAVGEEHSWPHSVVAIRNIASRPSLARDLVQGIPAIVGALQQALAAGYGKNEDCGTAMQAAIRLVAAMGPADPARGEALTITVMPVLDRLGAAMGAGQWPEVERDLAALDAIVRYCPVESGSPQCPLVMLTVRVCALLPTLVDSGGDGGPPGGALQLASRVLESLAERGGAAMNEMLPLVLQAALALLPYSLWAMGKVVLRHADHAARDERFAAEVLGPAVAACCVSGWPEDLLGAQCDLLASVLTTCPKLLLLAEGGAAFSLLTALRALSTGSFETCRAALTCVEALLAPPRGGNLPGRPELAAAVATTLATQGAGETLVVALMSALAGVMPESLMGELAGALRAVIVSQPGCAPVLVDVLRRGAATDDLAQAGEQFVALAMQTAPRLDDRELFDSLVNDFGGVCRLKLPVSVLQQHAQLLASELSD